MISFKTSFKVMAALACVGLFSACNSDENAGGDSQYEISIAKSADYKVVSGGETLVKSGLFGGTLNAEEPELKFFKESDCPDLYKANFPDQKLYKPECEYVYACIKEDAALIAQGKAPKYEVDKNSFTYKAFYIINAYSSKDHDAKGNHSDVAGDMHELGMNGVYIKEFRTNVMVAADLILTEEGLKDVTYDDSFGVKGKTYTTSNWKLFYIPDYGYYVGMDYGTNKFGYEPDGDYSDWVIKLVPAEKKEEPIDETNGSVEINYSVNDEKVEGDYIATKLSIHVRAITDAEVFIPVDKQYFCEADDMDISLSHKQKDIIYNTDPQVVSMNVGGNTVTLTVQYEDGGIRITTSGVNKQVIDFCAETYSDGITFEVWNYFKDITRAELKPMLDKATVTFITSNPKLYVNAFAKENAYEVLQTPIYSKLNAEGQLVPYTDEACTQPLDQKYWTRENPDDKDYIFVGVKNPWDCTVAPVEKSYKKTEQDNDNPTLPNYNVQYEL